MRHCGPVDGVLASLAAVHATVFPARGLCLGASVHHVACDDASTMPFIRTWAAACRIGLESDGGSEDAALSAPLVLDSSLVADPDDLRGKTLAGMARLAAPSLLLRRRRSRRWAASGCIRQPQQWRCTRAEMGQSGGRRGGVRVGRARASLGRQRRRRTQARDWGGEDCRGGERTRATGQRRRRWNGRTGIPRRARRRAGRRRVLG
ncbi:hypothetical protein C2845_PM13G22050 [Panicum miliaceum]|uniref:Uncharacterized protein n=1 Tax=Panicum miliaceum TaxID=4540 RepID=A0A3L6RMV3_PANMI|nr:hypothetical protein C2845_PM13G22050 [Panicum miliaceum]